MQNLLLQIYSIANRTTGISESLVELLRVIQYQLVGKFATEALQLPGASVEESDSPPCS